MSGLDFWRDDEDREGEDCEDREELEEENEVPARAAKRLLRRN